MQPETQSIRKTAVVGVGWVFMERWGAQFISIIVSFILARLVAPEEYGKISLCVVFISILNNFVSSGMGSALIQKKGADELDFSSLFYFNIILGLVLFGIIFFSSPVIGSFFHQTGLTPVIRFLGLFFVISSFKEIQSTYAFKHLLFRKFFFATLGGTIIAAILGIYLAYQGYGVWALACQLLCNNLIDTIILWFTVRWYPRMIFSFARLKVLFAFGWKMMVAGLIDNAYQNLRHLLIGRIYTPTDLAFYEKGGTFPRIITHNLNHAIDSVLFPTFSLYQDDPAMLKSMVRRAIKTSVFLMSPLLMGMAASSPTMIKILLTEKWLPCVPYLIIACITYVFYPIHTANLNAIKALGRSDLFVKLEILKKTVGIIITFIAIWFGMFWLACSAIITSFLSQLINTWPNKRLLNYSYMEQIRDIFPNLILACSMGGVVYFLKFLSINPFLLLFIQILVGGMYYVVFAMIFKLESCVYLIKIIRNKCKR